MRFGLLALLLVACTPPPLAGAQAAAVRSVETVHGNLGVRADEFLTAASRDGFSGAVIVESDGELILAGGYGLADREMHRPFTIDTIAQLGSNTKSFTGAAIADLERRGLVDINQPVSHYLPGGAQPAASATIRQLLTHTSGMREYCGDDFAPLSRSALLNSCMANPLDQPLGQDGTAYSNPGYSVLAAVVEVVSGQSIEDYVRERLLAPMHIIDGGYTITGEARTRLAAGYNGALRQEPISERLVRMHGDYWNLKGNGGMQMSARDVYRWFLGLSCRAEMNDDLRRRVVRPLSEPAGDPDQARGTRVAEGYGWAFRTTRNGTPFKLAHAGSDGVFLAYEYWRPYDRSFLYFVSNIGEARARQFLNQLREVLGDSRQLNDADVVGRGDPWACAPRR